VAKRLLSRWAVPLALLALLIFTFGLAIPFLGFYWDDWPVILTGRLQGAAGYVQFYQYDRPVSAWTYILSFPVLGSRPAAWHIFTLLLRWLTTVALWWTLIRLWPGHRREASWSAFLFAIYPVFTQQSISVAYSQHWTCYLLYFVSLGSMVQAFRSPRHFRGLTALSLATSLLHLLTMEYFAGLELLRPLLLWVLIGDQPGRRRARWMAVLRGWLPYMVLLGGFVIWRLFFLTFPGQEANPPVLLKTILATPVDGLLRFMEISAQDTVHLLITVWSNILAPANIALRDPFILFSWGMGVLAAAGVAIFLLRMQQKVEPLQSETDSAWKKQVLVIGAAALLLGMLPVWFTDRQIIVGTYSNRFGLPAMFGASLLMAGLIAELLRKPVQRIVMLGLLVGLAVSMHLRVANNFRWSWVKQTRFYHQLSWRAPAMQPGTAIFSDGEIFPYVGLYSHAAAINLIYPPKAPAQQLPFYFFSLGRNFGYSMPAFQKGMPLKIETFRHYIFNGHTKDGIVIYYNPDEQDCLEVLIPEDANDPGLPEITRRAVQNSNLSRILPGPQPAGFPPEEIFGPEPERGWCYLYQKADLARQLGKWEEVVALGDEAREAGYDPKASSSNTSVEWMPMIEGYARVGRWDEAEALSLAAFEKDQRIDARLCNLWDHLVATTPASEDRDLLVEVVRESARCP